MLPAWAAWLRMLKLLYKTLTASDLYRKRYISTSLLSMVVARSPWQESLGMHLSRYTVKFNRVWKPLFCLCETCHHTPPVTQYCQVHSLVSNHTTGIRGTSVLIRQFGWMQTYVSKHYNKLLSLIEHLVHQQTLLHKSFSVAAWKNTWHESMYYKAFTTTTVLYCCPIQFLNKHYPEVNFANSSVKLMYIMINIITTKPNKNFNAKKKYEVEFINTIKH